jgi:hypothetical protein
MKRFLLLVSGGLLFACDDGTRSCTAADCRVGAPVQIQLVDASDAPVGARGEYRISSGPDGFPTVTPFDCSAKAEDAGTANYNCSNGVVRLDGANHPRFDIEVRFELAQGGLTEWSTLGLVYSSQTIPDFSGPGCPCTRYNADDRTLLVPEGARRPLPGAD